MGKRKAVELQTEVTILNNQSLIEQAIRQGSSIEHLEKLMGLQERWEANQARKLFFESLAQFQNICPTLEKTKRVSFTTSKGQTSYNYTPLGEIAQTIKESMHECGLSHRWEMQQTNKEIKCTCIISHIAGHKESSSMTAAKDESGGKNDIQSRASAITYLQRYTLIASLGISTADEDNDAQTSRPEKPIEKSKSKTKNSTLSDSILNAKTEKELLAIWKGLSKDEKKLYSSIKDEVKEKLRLQTLKAPLNDSDSIFDIEDKMRLIKSKTELDKFIKLNMKMLDETDSPQLRTLYKELANSFVQSIEAVK